MSIYAIVNNGDKTLSATIENATFRKGLMFGEPWSEHFSMSKRSSSRVKGPRSQCRTGILPNPVERNDAGKRRGRSECGARTLDARASNKSKNAREIQRHVKKFSRYFRLIIQLCILLGVHRAGATPIPFIDGPFTTLSEDGDPDLIIVREQFNPTNRTQSLYIRFADGTPDQEILSGTLTLHGAQINGVIADHQSLKESDLTWGISAVDYGLNRGLEGDPTATMPSVESSDDLLVVDENQIRFWFSTTADTDDFRVLIQYPIEHASAHLTVTLWHLRGRDVEGYPLTTPGSDGQTGGVVIGSTTDFVPDDGDYGEIRSIDKIRLKIEDFDIIEDELYLGDLDHRGGVVGPVEFTIDNFANGVDYDSDNGEDQNGALNPVPNTGSIDRLRLAKSSLTNADGFEIPADQIQVLGIPSTVAEGGSHRPFVSVSVLENTPAGEYSGFITVWEDNDGSGTIDPNEPSDYFVAKLTITPTPRPDLGLSNATDSGLDMSLVDATGIWDVSVVDSEILDMSDHQLDAQTQIRDAVITPYDTSLMEDQGRVFDLNFQDVLLTQDLSLEEGDLNARNLDSSATADVSVDAQVTWSGRPTGGGIDCTQGPQHSTFVTVLLLLFVVRMRR